MKLETFESKMLLILLVCFGICIFFAMLRAIKGPRVADRIMAINMIGSTTVLSIATLAVMLGEGYLLDVCLIYVLISFLSVVVLCKVFITVYLNRKKDEQ